MTVLALDTSTLVGDVALVNQDRVVAESKLKPGETHSKTLLPEIKKMLDRAGLEVRDLEFIAVGLGPGSFTGLRIGLAAAKGLAWAAGIPLVGVPTLEAMVRALPPRDITACPLLDARRNQVYFALYQTGPGGGWERESPYQARTPADLAVLIREKTWFIGEGAGTYGNILTEMLGSFFVRGPQELDYPQAVQVAWLAYELMAAGTETDPTRVVPIYVRPLDIRPPE
ncbi:MAG: tRNA (adenosine(37)-N6)-threonylcarbamoyltransferase complex dimerization subunit type 1 TsaB [Pseudomonadota bacterium]